MIRSSLTGLLALAALPAIAQCPHTQNAVVADLVTGQIQEIVIPSCDTELDDPAFQPPGTIQVRTAVSSDPVAAASSSPTVVSSSMAVRAAAAVAAAQSLLISASIVQTSLSAAQLAQPSPAASNVGP